MRLKPKAVLRPATPEPGGTYAGWFIPHTNYLVDATLDSIRVWDLAKNELKNSLAPAQSSIGRPNGAVTVYPGTHRIITAHENAVKPFSGDSVIVWQLPDLQPVIHRKGHAAVEPGISMGASRRHFVTFSGEEASATTPGLIVWDLRLNAIAKWKESPKGEPRAIEERAWVASSRCRVEEPGVEIRTYDGHLHRTIAEDAPVTHQIFYREGQLWLFQEEGLLDLWDADTMTRIRSVSLGHQESMRDDYPVGAVVCLDDLDAQTVATLGTDGTVKFWKLPGFECLLERPFEMLPNWIDVDRERRMLAVGFAADGIELFSIG
jgi:WD40 repeat protein